MEKSNNERALVVESDDALRRSIVHVLSDAGYEVSTDCDEGMKSLVGFGPDVVILGADPPRLDCCNLLSEIKGSERTQNMRVLMLSPGGSAQRTRGLDLGADDVLSLPIDPHELLSCMRWQLRNKHTIENLEHQAGTIEENRAVAQQVVAAVKEDRRALRVGGTLAVALSLVGVITSLIFYGLTQQQNTRIYAAVTKLQTGILTQQKLMDRSFQPVQDVQPDPSPRNDSENISALQSQLSGVQERLQRVETASRVAQTIIQSYEPSVCLIHVVVGFRDHTNGLKLHYVGLTSTGEPVTDDHNNPILSTAGAGPEVHLDIFGTGFLVSDKGQILTNHHVAEPWWNNDDFKEMTDQAVEPMLVEMTAYFPNVTHGIPVTTETISPNADVALLRGSISGPKIRDVDLADGHRSALNGGPVVLIGYPTGLDAILARTGEETLRSIAVTTKGDPKKVLEELARRHLIRPVVTQGHIGDVLPDKIIYDAQTTSGGSGGPLFSSEGKVIGISFAMVRNFSGSNLAIPIAYGESLLKP